MLLYSGLPIAELTRTSLTDTWNRGTRGTEGHEENEKYEDTRRSQNEIDAMATHLKYKRGYSAQLWRGTNFNLLQT